MLRKSGRLSSVASSVVLYVIEKDCSNYKVRVLEKRVTSSILKEYKEFKHLFAEVVDSKALLKH